MSHRQAVLLIAHRFLNGDSAKQAEDQYGKIVAFFIQLHFSIPQAQQEHRKTAQQGSPGGENKRR
ncbi:hypothetical protein D3C77_607920 [compost metagenome]